MAKRIKCPACGARGEASDDVHFEVRGQFKGMAVRMCLACGAGIFLKPPFGRTEVIPPDLWGQMRERSAEEFGSESASDDDEDDYPIINQVIHELFDETPSELPTPVIVLASAAQDVAGGALRSVAAEDPTNWSGLDAASAKGLVRCGATYFVLSATHDEALRSHFSQWLDLRPSEVSKSILATYCMAYLTAGESQLVEKMIKQWEDEDSSGFAMALGQLMWEASGGVGMPPITVAVQWRAALHGLREVFGRHFLSELERYADGN